MQLKVSVLSECGSSDLKLSRLEVKVGSTISKTGLRTKSICRQLSSCKASLPLVSGYLFHPIEQCTFLNSTTAINFPKFVAKSRFLLFSKAPSSYYYFDSNLKIVYFKKCGLKLYLPCQSDILR